MTAERLHANVKLYFLIIITNNPHRKPFFFARRDQLYLRWSLPRQRSTPQCEARDHDI